MRAFINKNQKLIGVFLAIIATGIATVYLFVVPEKTTDTSGAVRLVLMYGHSLCWLLLASSAMLWSIKRYPAARAWMTWSALGVYGIFLFCYLFA